MLIVRLEQEDWNRVLAVLSQAPWNIANPLIMAIGDQLRHQAAQGSAADLRPSGQAPRPDGDGRGLHDDGAPTTGPFGEGPPNRAKPQ